MSEYVKKEKIPKDAADTKPLRKRGVGNSESHSQDADRHHRIEHQKSDKQTDLSS